MTIEINSDKSIDIEKRHKDYFTSQLENAFERYHAHLTRIEVHLKDQNGKKGGVKDKICTIEARMKGRKPIAVTAEDDSIEKAISSAADKALSALSSDVGKMLRR